LRKTREKINQMNNKNNGWAVEEKIFESELGQVVRDE
jgi:hypothetical protein